MEISAKKIKELGLEYEYYLAKKGKRLGDFPNERLLNLDMAKTKLKKKIKYGTEFKRKQKDLKQNLKKCQECGDNKYLQVHHIDKDKSNNEDSNLILLCFRCHKKHHPHLRLPEFLMV